VRGLVPFGTGNRRLTLELSGRGPVPSARSRAQEENGTQREEQDGDPADNSPDDCGVVIAAGWLVEAKDMILLALPSTVVTLALSDDVAEGSL
jgi:hypothetical protein